MIPMALNMKRTEAGYLATDLSPVMIDLAKVNVKKHYEMFGDSKDYERWLERVSLFFRVADGEEFIEAHNGQKFDRIISNLVLNLTLDARKMVKNFHRMAAEECLLGISIPTK